MKIDPTIFYALALFTALLQSFFGTVTGFGVGGSPFLYVFGKLAGFLGILTWIWIAILIIFSRKARSANVLCRSYTHFTSFAVFGVVWLAIFIMLASQTTFECNGTTRWCAVARFSTALACLTSLFSIIAAYLVYRSAAASGSGLASNVNQAPKELSEQ